LCKKGKDFLKSQQNSLTCGHDVVWCNGNKHIYTYITSANTKKSANALDAHILTQCLRQIWLRHMLLWWMNGQVPDVHGRLD